LKQILQTVGVIYFPSDKNFLFYQIYII